MNAEPAVKTGGNILIVDDTPANLRLLADMLQQSGYEVRPVLSGRLALEAVRAAQPDLVLLGINMPVMDGYEVCQRFKADPRLRDIPIIFVSALHETLEKVKGFAVGAVDYITKPFQNEAVEARVKTHLEVAHLRRELERHNTRLEDTVRQRTRQLVEANQQLVDANARLAILDQAKSGFLGLAPALAERIVTLYGGSLTVENLAPPGIRLTVNLKTPAPCKP